MKRNNSPAIRRMYNDLLMDAARAEKQGDPYVLYGKAYEGGNKNKEALDYLLNTSVTRGYTDDCPVSYTHLDVYKRQERVHINSVNFRFGIHFVSNRIPA